MLYYIVVFVYNRNNYYTLWYSDDIDGFVINSKGKMVNFTCQNDMNKYVKNKRIKIQEEITYYDCDFIKSTI